MKKIIAILAMGVLTLGTSLMVQAKEVVPSAGNHFCPISGDAIEKGKEVDVEYKGKNYHLCCKMCIKDFKKNPEKYIEKMKTMEKRASEEIKK